MGLDMNTLIPALISAAVTLIICVINNHAEQERSRTLIDYRLGQLELKVDKHNNLIERTYKLEEIATLHEEKIKVVNHRLADLEKGDDGK